jgi:hypothetical protein
MSAAGWTFSLNSGSTLTFQGLTIATTPSTQPSVSFSVAAALTINSGATLDPTAGTITKTGGSIVNSGGASTNLKFYDLAITGVTTTSSDFEIDHSINSSGSGNLTPSGGTITANTGSSITISATLVFKGLTIANAATVTTASYFAIGAALTIGNASSNFSPSAGTITMNTGATIEGRLLAQAAAIDLDSNIIVRP